MSIPEITLELSGGTLTIRTDEVIYHIWANAGLAGVSAPPPYQLPSPPAAVPVLASAPAAPPAAASGLSDDEDYYQELSKDMFDEVGRLARRLSMSIRDVNLEKIDSIDFNAAGEQLEEAKDQLENVVKMTEQATLRIMDLTEGIQSSVDNARTLMEQMRAETASADSAADAEAESAQSSAAAQELQEALLTLSEFLNSLGQEPLAPLEEEVQNLLAQMRAASASPTAAPSEPVPAAPPSASAYYSFPLEVIFQTVYELCTNEAVKKHIKVMWDAGEKGFDAAKVEADLNHLAAGGPDADGYLNLDLTGVLKALFQATSQEKFQQIFKKMAGTIDQIFLEQTLPLEAAEKEPPAAAQSAPAASSPEAAAPAGPVLSPEILEKTQTLLDHLKDESVGFKAPALPDLPALLSQALAGSSRGGSDAVKISSQNLQLLEQSIGEIFAQVNSIVEALSFQDLAGQAIYRTVKMLTDFQVQLLAMVVSFGNKIKTRETTPTVTTEQVDQIAQQEVDKMLDSLATGSGRMQQESVNDLLASFGF